MKNIFLMIITIFIIFSKINKEIIDNNIVRQLTDHIIKQKTNTKKLKKNLKSKFNNNVKFRINNIISILEKNWN